MLTFTSEYLLHEEKIMQNARKQNTATRKYIFKILSYKLLTYAINEKLDRII